MTSNPGKFGEVAALLRSHGVTVDRLDRSYPEVQADTLHEVVTAALDWLGHRHRGDLLVDDSALFVDALDGFPGVYSAYVYRTIGVEGVLKLLEGEEDRAARFETCLGLRRSEQNRLFHGRCPGTVVRSPQGRGGFGFDPVFKPEGHERTFAEMTEEEKNRVSHRGRAVRALATWLEAG